MRLYSHPNGSFYVRRAVAEDMPAVHALIHELAIYEKAGHEHSCTVETLVADGFGQKPLFECLVGCLPDGNIIGMALFYTKYSTWKGACMYLDDLIVTEAYRGIGLGKVLLTQLMCLARDRQMQRLEWQVLDWNEPAIDFYRKMGALLESEWVNCRLTFEQLQDFCPERR
jgi:GNAT superfamily N-acetyltransferase